MAINSNDLRKLDDRELLSATENIVKAEREILICVLHHLREIDRRKLYSALKYKSLFEYTVKKLGYSEDQMSLQSWKTRPLGKRRELSLVYHPVQLMFQQRKFGLSLRTSLNLRLCSAMIS